MMSDPTIVIADDEVHILRVLELKLSGAGFTCVKACDGLVAWQQILRVRPVLVISDYQMPGLDGVSLAEKMYREESLRHIPFILLTARGFSVNREDVAETHIVHKISKPFSPRELLALVHEVLGSSVQEGSVS